MAENKISRERIKELKQMDPFQEKLLKALAYAKEYKKQLILIAGAVVLVAVVFSGILHSFRKAENTAAILVNQALTQYANADDPDKVKIVLKSFSIFTEYNNTTAGKLAKVKFAKICYDASKFDQSYKYYKESFEIFKDDGLMKNFLLAALGNVSLARKEFEEAKKYFLQIEEGKADLLKDEAGFSLAMLDETAGNKAESKKMYEKVVLEHENSMYSAIAKSKIDEMP